MTPDIAIIGTGLSGLTAALSFAHARQPVTLIGEAPVAKTDKRTTAIMASGIDHLKKLSVWQHCAAHAVPLMTMELIDGDNHFIYDASETQLNEFGFNIPNRVLRDAFLQTIAKNKNITWIKENVEKAVRTDKKWTLSTVHKKHVTADLVIAADGRNSLMRKSASIDTTMRDEDQTALVGVLEASKAHHYTSAEWYRAGGPLTFVPMQGKKLAIVWCEKDRDAQMNKKKSLGDLSHELTAITAQRYGTLRFLSAPQTWPIKPMKAERLVKDGVVLIGEAAHVLPPIGAQGFNTSIQDILTLQECFDQAARIGLTVNDPAILGRYERVRMTDINVRYHGMTRLNDLIRSRHPALSMVRGFGLRSLHRFAPLKKQVMKFGLGHTLRGMMKDGTA